MGRLLDTILCSIVVLVISATLFGIVWFWPWSP